jgi:hypothetical protein
MRVKLSQILVCCVLAAAGLGVAQEDARLAAPVERSFQCIPIGELLPELSKLAGVPLEADPEVADYMVFLYVRGRPLSEVMVHLADCYQMEWVPRGGGYRLALSEHFRALVLAREQAELRGRLAAAQATLARYREAARLTEAEREKKLEELEGQPIYDQGGLTDLGVLANLDNFDVRVAMDLLAGWSEEDWALLVREGTIVYSTQPTAAQRQLDGKYVAQGRQWQTEAPELFREWDKNRWFHGRQSHAYAYTGESPEAFLDPSAIHVVKLRFLWQKPGHLVARCEALGEDRIARISGAWHVQAYYEPPHDGRAMDHAANPALHERYTAPEHLRSLANGTMDAFNEEYGKWIQDHEVGEFLDPLNVLVGPYLTSIADRLDASLVVPVSDLFIEPYHLEMSGPFEWVLWSFTRDPSVPPEYDSETGWVVCRLSDGSPEGLQRPSFSRKWFRRCLDIVESSKPPSMDFLIELAAGLSQEQFDGGLQALRVLPWGWGVPDTMLMPRSPRDLAFWTALTEEQRKALRGGKEVKASELGTSARRALLDHLVGDPDRRVDPTEWLYEGLPGSVRISLWYRPGTPYLWCTVFRSEGASDPPCWSDRPTGATGAELYQLELRGLAQDTAVLRGEWWTAWLRIVVAPGVETTRSLEAQWVDWGDYQFLDDPDEQLAEFIREGGEEWERYMEELRKTDPESYERIMKQIKGD